MPSSSLLLAIRADATKSIGVGHAVRQLALAEEWLGRGHRVIFIGELAIDWVASAWTELGVPIKPSSTDVAALGVDVVVIDGYHLPTTLGLALQAAGIPVVAVIDGPFGAHQPADLYVDQNLGATRGPARLAGLEYALLRDTVLAARDLAPQTSNPPRLLVVFGGTDAFDGCVPTVSALLTSGCAVAVEAIAATSDIKTRLAQLPVPTGCQLTVSGPVANLLALAARCDAVVTAAGTSVWEFMCVGTPIGLVWVTDNQRVGYDECVARDLVVGFGPLAEIVANPEAARAATRRLIEPSRLANRGRGRNTVDGNGRARVADALVEIASKARPQPLN